MPEKVRILHVIKSLGRGGAEMLLPESLRLHDRAAFEFHYVYFLPWKDQMVASIKENGGEVTCLRAGNNLQLMTKVFALMQYVRDHHIQVIHAHLPWAGILARIVGKFTRIPVIYSEHNKQERYHFLTRFVNLSTMNWASQVLPVSGDVEVSIRHHMSRVSTSIKTILNGVNTDHFNPGAYSRSEMRLKLHIPEDAPVIGTVAVFRTQKRLDLWIRLAAEILQQTKDVHFVVVGDGPLKEELLKVRGDLGLNERLHFPGIQTEIRPYLATFDIFMMTSIFEGLPLALLEAMSMQCAVIATDAGGVKEVIRSEVDGLLCSVDNPELVVEFAVRLLSFPDLRKRFGEQARQRVQTNFSLASMVVELEQIYKNWAFPQ
ncbi:MAG TPA: glycosyltransferase [Chryseolinea sp.]|nr:glycosyltransferase [Chryseolinea sp.]